MSRSVYCEETATGTSVADENCDPDSRVVDERDCNTRPCLADARYWQTGAFGICTVLCGGGTQERTVKCVDALGAAQPEEQCLADGNVGAKPAQSVVCNTHSCAPCADQDCSTQGTCAVTTADPTSATCTCDAGFAGPFCSTPDSCSGGLDKDGKCCAGVLMEGGICCGTSPVAAIDAQGSCCESGALDACGVCDGDATAFSVTGECCGPSAAPELDGAGLCCDAGFVDACGVCGGDGRSCAISMTLVVAAPDGTDVAAVANSQSSDYIQFSTVDFPAMVAPLLQISADRIQVAEVQSTGNSQLRVSFVILPDRTSDAASTLISRINSVADPSGTGVLSVSSISTDGVCNNNICEYGEACSTGSSQECCPNDCPIVQQVCPTPEGTAEQCGGHTRGQCVAATGTCSCWQGVGYAGVDCGECAPGYARSAGLCAPVFDITTGLGSLDSGEAFPTWAIAVIAILGAAVLFIVVYYGYFGRRKSTDEEKNSYYGESRVSSKRMNANPMGRPSTRYL